MGIFLFYITPLVILVIAELLSSIVSGNKPKKRSLKENALIFFLFPFVNIAASILLYWLINKLNYNQSRELFRVLVLIFSTIYIFVPVFPSFFDRTLSQNFYKKITFNLALIAFIFPPFVFIQFLEDKNNLAIMLWYPLLLVNYMIFRFFLLRIEMPKLDLVINEDENKILKYRMLWLIVLLIIPLMAFIVEATRQTYEYYSR